MGFAFIGIIIIVLGAYGFILYQEDMERFKGIKLDNEFKVLYRVKDMDSGISRFEIIPIKTFLTASKYNKGRRINDICKSLTSNKFYSAAYDITRTRGNYSETYMVVEYTILHEDVLELHETEFIDSESKLRNCNQNLIVNGIGVDEKFISAYRLSMDFTNRTLILTLKDRNLETMVHEISLDGLKIKKNGILLNISNKLKEIEIKLD